MRKIKFLLAGRAGEVGEIVKWNLSILKGRKRGRTKMLKCACRLNYVK